MTISHIDTEERKTLERLCDAIATIYAPLHHNAHVILKAALDAPKFGASDVCSQCGETIRFTGEHWAHKYTTPRHIATPKGNS